MDSDAAREGMTMALLEVADVELRGCDSMDPVIALGQRDGGRLTAYAHLRPLAGATGLFPFNVEPARRAFHHDGVDVFGFCYGVWQDRAGALIAQPEGIPGRQAGVIVIVGRRGRVTATFYQIAWDETGFCGFRATRRLASSPVGDLLADPGDEAVIPMSAWPRNTGKDQPR